MSSTEHQAYGSPYPPAAPASTGNRIGSVALLLAVGLVLVGAVQQSLIYFLPALVDDFSASTYGAIQAPFTVLQVLLAIAALVLGVIGLLRRGAPKGAAGAATALAASALFSTLLGFVLGFAADVYF